MRDVRKMALLLVCTLVVVAVPGFAEEAAGPAAPLFLGGTGGSCATAASPAGGPQPVLILPDLGNIEPEWASNHLCNKPCSTCAEAELKCGWDCWCRNLCEYSFQCYAANPCASSCICTPC